MSKTAVMVLAGIGLVLAGAPDGVAQAQALPARPGITMTGSGVVRRPADTAHVAITLSNNAGRGTPQDALKAADDFVRALKAAGVDDAMMVNPLNGIITAQRFVTITGTLHKPSLDRIQKLVASVSAALPSNDVVIQNVNASLSLDDCTAALGIAEKAAFDDAHDRAQRFATIAHVALGPVTALTEFGTPGLNGACPTKPDTVVNVNGGGNPFGNAAAFDVVIPVNVTVTFALQ